MRTYLPAPSRSFRLRYRSQQDVLRTALFPGNERLCLEPDATLGLVQERTQDVPEYRALLDHLCHGSQGRSLALNASLLVLVVLLAAAVLLGAAYLQHGLLLRRWQHFLRWWHAGYLPARMDGLASQPCSKEDSRHGAAAAAAACTRGALQLVVRPGRRLEPVLQAVELAQASIRASGGRKPQNESQQAQQAQQVMQPPPHQQQQQPQAAQLESATGPLELADLPPLPLLPSTALLLPQHEGQPLVLGRTSRSMVR